MILCFLSLFPLSVLSLFAFFPFDLIGSSFLPSLLWHCGRFPINYFGIGLSKGLVMKRKCVSPKSKPWAVFLAAGWTTDRPHVCSLVLIFNRKWTVTVWCENTHSSDDDELLGKSLRNFFLVSMARDTNLYWFPSQLWCLGFDGTRKLTVKPIHALFLEWFLLRKKSARRCLCSWAVWRNEDRRASKQISDFRLFYCRWLVLYPGTCHLKH